MNILRLITTCIAAWIAGCAQVQPVSAPVARIEAPAARTAESWSYDEIDPYRREVVGSLSQSAGGGAARHAFAAPYTRLPFPVAPDMQWSETIEAVDTHGGVYAWRVAGRSYGWERVQTPAGSFDALRIVRTMNLGDGDGQWRSTTRRETLWYAPAVNGWVRLERRDTQLELVGLAPRSRDDWRVWELRRHSAG